MATPQQQAEFRESGFTIVPQFLAQDECDDLLKRIRDAQAQVAGSRLDKTGLAFKHNLYKASAALRDFVSQKKVVYFLRDIIGPDFWVRWDQTVEKTPGGAEFPWHQDNGYNGLKDGHFQLWISLSEMTPDNGGLWLQRGSHRNGVMKHHVVGNHMVCPGDESTAEFIPAKPGDMVLFSSLMLHRTSPNTTTTSRLAYVIEYMSLRHYDPYIPAPYFVVARNGEPHQEFVNYYAGRLNPVNQLKYVLPRTKRALHHMRVRLAGMVKGEKQPAAN